MFYRSAIVDELGNVMFWCSELSETEKNYLLATHKGWSIKRVPIRG